jgi:hypothetical protein
VKEKLRIKNYVRYMDDFTLLHPDKKYLEFCKGEIARFLERDCKLVLNEKTQIFAMKQGVDFLGWHFYVKEPTGKIVRLLRRDSKERRRRKNKKLMKIYPSLTTYAERVDFMAHFAQSMASWRGHAKHGDTHRLVKKIYGEVRFVKGD